MDSVTAMGPKINGNNIAELVKLEVEKTVNTQKNELLEMKNMFEEQLDRAHELLLGAMARITCLENEINKYHQNTYKHSTSSSSSLPKGRVPSSQLCRHWLRNRCTWRENCNFRHGGDGSVNSSANSAFQLSASSSYQAEEMKANIMKADNMLVEIDNNYDDKIKVSEVDQVKLPNFDQLLLPPKHPGCSKSETKSRSSLSKPAVPTIGHIVHNRFVSSGDHSKSNKTATPLKSPQKQEDWPKAMLAKVNALEARYSDSFTPKMGDDGITHSGKVMIPKIDFSKVKPHLHRNLPKPGLYSVHSCSQDPDFYHKATEYTNYDRGRWPKFQCTSPFGLKAAFETNLGLVAVPEEPIGGYIYKSGGGDSTIWQLFADAIYI